MSNMTLTCACGRKIRVQEKHAGRKTRCKDCQAVIQAPAADFIQQNVGREIPITQLRKVETSRTPPGVESTIAQLSASTDLSTKSRQIDRLMEEMKSSFFGKRDDGSLTEILQKSENVGSENLSVDERTRLRIHAIGKLIITGFRWLLLLMVILPLLRMVGIIDWSGWWVMSPWLFLAGLIASLGLLTTMFTGKGLGCAFGLCNGLFLFILPALKLFGTISISWWWVMTPLYIVLLRGMFRKSA